MSGAGIATGRHRQRATTDKNAGERSKCVSSKPSTDRYWNQRAVTEPDPAKVNMPDTVQRDFELTFVFKHLVAHRALG